MNKERLLQLLQGVEAGRVSPEDALEQIGCLSYTAMDFARVDDHRALRDNFPEVVFCAGKTDQQVAAIIKHLADFNPCVLGTRAAPSHYKAVKALVPDIKYDETAGVIYLQQDNRPELGKVAVLTAGTADIPVAEEAAICLQVMGARVERIYDVGVAGLHRLLDQMTIINQAKVVIVIAGMEGALPSVVGGLTSRPVIAVPTSTGYGASFNGLAALLAMLNSCASGVGVVNIDNGYGAAALAYAILTTING